MHWLFKYALVIKDIDTKVLINKTRPLISFLIYWVDLEIGSNLVNLRWGSVISNGHWANMLFTSDHGLHSSVVQSGVHVSVLLCKTIERSVVVCNDSWVIEIVYCFLGQAAEVEALLNDLSNFVIVSLNS